jgi:putative sterol carrier protein
MPPGVFPFDPEKSPEEIAENQVKLMMGGILGSPDSIPQTSPELQRLYFDVVERVVNTKAANGSRLVYQWRFTDAEPWHLVIDNGSTHAEPGEAPNPNLVLEASWGDFIATGRPDSNPLKMVLTRRLRPRGSFRELARMRKVFPS